MAQSNHADDKNVNSKQQIKVYQKNAVDTFSYNKYFSKPLQYFTEVTDAGNMNWLHKENNFSDFNVQYLIPHAQSTRGPKIAVADINKDGLDDIYLCGAAGQAGQLLVQTAQGKFVSADTAVFAAAKASEDVDAVFFDANNDTYPDLYVVSGGNEFADGSMALVDHFYLNNGKGHFIKTDNAIPSPLKNKSCISTADFDKDGDTDLFIGGLDDAKAFGVPQPSYLLVNDGKGIFSLAGASTIALTNLGIVTGSSFADMNNDGWPDLVVTGEWMPLKIFINNKGRFSVFDIPQSSGLWQTVYTSDINGDGFTDILAGNWGCNSKLYAGKDGPLKLYIKDFDNNGTVEQIMAYTINGKEYSFLAKDELERALPVLKKYYLTYSEVAGKDVQYMFYDLFKDYVELKAETLASCCFLNDGKGGFTKIVLPVELQLAPIFSFVHCLTDDKKSFLAGGNFYGVTPYEGRYDGLQPTIFSFNSKGDVFNIIGNISSVNGELRDSKWIKTTGGNNILVLARNKSELSFFKEGK